MIGGNEAHARVLINAQLKDQSWDLRPATPSSILPPVSVVRTLTENSGTLKYAGDSGFETE